MISARKTNHSTRDRLDRRQPIVAGTTIVSIHVIFDALHVQELPIATFTPHLQHSCVRQSFKQREENTLPLHTFPIVQRNDSAVSCIELC